MNFNEELKQRVEQINALLAAKLPAEEGMQQRVAEAMNYSVNAGGKRLRPMLLLEVYRRLGGTDEKITEPFMAALECIHTYSLVHDDLPAMDNDDYRRGKLTTHKKFGEDFGVLAGDGLLNYAYELLFNGISEVTEPDDLIRCVKAAKVIAYKAGIYGMVGGQSLDVWLTDKPMNEAQLEFIFNLKTGALIEAAFMAGAILAGADDRTVEKMEKVLYTIDELTGLINAACLMRPSKSVLDIEVKSVKKKFKSSGFAAGVNREVIQKGCDMIGLSLDDVIKETIEGMKSCADAIGLRGNISEE